MKERRILEMALSLAYAGQMGLSAEETSSRKALGKKKEANLQKPPFTWFRLINNLTNILMGEDFVHELFHINS